MTVAGGPLHEQVLTAASALDATHAGIFAAGYSVLRVIVVGSAGISAGAVQLEGGPSPSYAGTWFAIGAAATATADTITTSGAGSTPLPFPYVRARISTAIAGGTVAVIIVGN